MLRLFLFAAILFSFQASFGPCQYICNQNLLLSFADQNSSWMSFVNPSSVLKQFLFAVTANFLRHFFSLADRSFTQAFHLAILLALFDRLNCFFEHVLLRVISLSNVRLFRVRRGVPLSSTWLYPDLSCHKRSPYYYCFLR